MTLRQYLLLKAPPLVILKTHRNGLHYWQLISHVTLIFCFPVLCSISRSSVGYVFLQYPLSLWDNFIAATLQRKKWFTFSLALIFEMENGIVSQHWSRRPPSLSLPFIHIYENAVYDSYTVRYICHTLHALLSVFSPPPTPSLVTKMLSLNHPSAFLDRRRYYETYVRYVGSL